MATTHVISVVTINKLFAVLFKTIYGIKTTKWSIQTDMIFSGQILHKAVTCNQ